MAARKAGMATARAPTNMAAERSRCLFMASWWLFVSLLWGPAAFADRNKEYHISHFCGRKNLQLIPNVGGAVLNAENATEINCVVSFRTNTVLQRFMLRFEKFKLDCNDHLYIYDNSNAHGNYKVNLSCSHNKRTVGIIYTEGNHVTLKYVTDGWVQMGSGFKLILTAIKSGLVCQERDFLCRNSFCIDKELTCDGVNHCNDNSDETTHDALCPDHEGTMGKVLGVEANVFISIVVTIFIICFMCIVGVVICICRRQRHQGTGVGGNLVGSGHPNYPMQHGYPPMSGGHPEKPPPYPGNMYPPAGGIGYNTHQGNIYYPTK